MTDRFLLKKFTDQQDQSAFAEVVSRHGGMVLAAARRLAREDADDVAQAVFLLLARKAPSLISHQNLAGWLFETTRNCAANARRDRRRHAAKLHSLSEVAMPDSQPSVVESDLLEKLDEGLSRLSNSYRQVLLMRYMENQSVEETAVQLGLSAAAVMKRSTRGLAKLRDFFARHGINGTAESLSAGMVGQAFILSAGQRMMLVSPGGGAQSLAETTRTPVQVPKAKIAVIAASVVVAVGISIPLLRSSAGSGGGVVPPPVMPAHPTPVAAAATLPALVPPVAGSPREAADLFLKALANADVDEVARYVPPGEEAKSIAQATTYVNDFRDKLYAAFPQRLTVQNASTMVANDGKQTPLGGTFDVQPPIEADLGHLMMTVAPVNGHWYVTATYTDADAMYATAADSDLTVSTQADTFDYSKAQSLFAAFAAMEMHTDPAQVKDSDIPKLIDSLNTARKALDQLPDALHGSALQFSSEDAKVLDGAIEDFEDQMRQHGAAVIVPTSTKMQKDPKIIQSNMRLMAIGTALQKKTDSQSEATHTVPRAVAIEPDRHLSGGGKAITIPGCLKFPEWLRTTSSYKDWQTKHDIRTFTTRDDAGNIYTIAAWGWVKDTAGITHEAITQIRMYRPDKTLAEVTNWSPMGGEPMDWTAMDSTGKAIAWKMTQHERNNGKVSIDTAIHFESNGDERRYQVNQEGIIDRVTAADAIGKNEVSIRP